eukprot:IDg5014t1
MDRLFYQGTDPFNRGWYSHKFEGPGIRYEVGVAIETGTLVWAHRPFPAGRYPDLKIFRLGMKNSSYEDEKVIADGTYRDDACVSPHNSPANMK